MLIFLIGYMGSGKSTVGRKLADRLKLQFLDLDAYIEERNLCAIPEIFAKEGENGFREKEHKALKEVADFENIIIATGGGVPCFFDNMQIINNAGISVYLDVHPKILAKRLLKSKIDRPLIMGKTPSELEDFLAKTLNQRSPFYQQAKLVIHVGEKETVEELVAKMEKLIKENRFE